MTTPKLISEIKTLAPIKGLFLSSVTLPENVFCENESKEKRKNRNKIYFFT